MRLALDVERGQRNNAEQLATAFRAAATATHGAVGSQHPAAADADTLRSSHDGIGDSLIRRTKPGGGRLVGSNSRGQHGHHGSGGSGGGGGGGGGGGASEDPTPTAVKMRLEALALKEEEQRAELASFQRRVAQERASGEAAAAMAAANLDYMVGASAELRVVTWSLVIWTKVITKRQRTTRSNNSFR